jgi:hypothetical protein
VAIAEDVTAYKYVVLDDALKSGGTGTKVTVGTRIQLERGKGYIGKNGILSCIE